MPNVSFSQATNAYQDALRTAQRIIQQTSIPSSDSAQSAQGTSFLDMVGASLKTMADSGYNSEKLATQSLSGKADLADVVTAVANAETALNTVVAVRDRVINAYQDIIKMPI